LISWVLVQTTNGPFGIKQWTFERWDVDG
jgi:hypothetical protein